LMFWSCGAKAFAQAKQPSIVNREERLSMVFIINITRARSAKFTLLTVK
jgi:hypothetical protein